MGPNKSYVLNEKLRNGEELTKEEKEMRDNLDTALRHFPTFEGRIMRVMNIDDEDLLKNFIDSLQGDNVSFPQYLSFSSKSGYNDDVANVIIYIDDSRKGRNMLQYGKYENEVLYERNAEFTLVNMQYSDGIWYILLEEK